MFHDFDEWDVDRYYLKEDSQEVYLGSHLAQGCNQPGKDGVMDYDYITGWSTCSQFDILRHCRALENCDCLKDIDLADTGCPGTGTGTTTTTTTTTTTLTTATTATTGPNSNPCGLPYYTNDQYCDLENNNAGCNWDGGACCNNNQQSWDLYCKFKPVSKCHNDL